ncbi:hypothetical protein ACMD2_13836 [Ananas comosus]|uniref:Uncharacterized protein n=1 Tax=Ananas comosus TaxID=4615 RepID=A0A199VHU8_ANACO|nr:hypothetical protein ACMD2_13836 [Ananas comosus]
MLRVFGRKLGSLSWRPSPAAASSALASANPTMHDDPSVSKSDSDSRPFSAPRFAFESILLGSSRGLIVAPFNLVLVLSTSASKNALALSSS